MSDIYLAVSETPTVVTLTSAVINSAVASSVTVMNTVTVALDANSLSALENVTVTVGAAITGTVTVGNFPATQAVSLASVPTHGVTLASTTVTVSSLPAISGVVTANLAGSFNGAIETINDVSNVSHAVAVHLYDDNGTFIGGSNNPFAVSGTVTIGASSVTFNSYVGQRGDGAWQALSLQTGSNYVNALVQNSVTIGGGTVTIGAGTAQIGSVTASISSFATSVTARLINPAGTAVTYAEVGTAGSPSIDVLSVQGVTSGTAIAISGTVTANPSISSTAITSGSFTSLTSATLVPANTARKMATVYNLGAGQLFVNAGASATTLGGGFMVALSSGDYFECGFTTTTLSAIYATAGTASWVSH